MTAILATQPSTESTSESTTESTTESNPEIPEIPEIIYPSSDGKPSIALIPEKNC